MIFAHLWSKRVQTLVNLGTLTITDQGPAAASCSHSPAFLAWHQRGRQAGAPNDQIAPFLRQGIRAAGGQLTSCHILTTGCHGEKYHGQKMQLQNVPKTHSFGSWVNFGGLLVLI